MGHFKVHVLAGFIDLLELVSDVSLPNLSISLSLIHNIALTLGNDFVRL